MGAKELHTKFICRPEHEKRDNTPQHNIGDIPCTSIGVDASGLMHKCLRTVKGAAVFDMTPPVPLFDAVESMMKKIRSLKSRTGKDIVMVFDGRSNPLKADEEARRDGLRDEDIKVLQGIYALDELGSYETVKEKRKGIVKRRDDYTTMIKDECIKLGIKISCGAFEADQQLVELQRHRLIDIIVSNDGDVFVLGGDNIATELDYYTGSCCFYQRSEILVRASMGSGTWSDELAALSCFLGNDFVDRLNGNGPVSVKTLMNKWVSCQDDTERGLLIHELEITKKWKIDDVNNAQGYTDKFWTAYWHEKCPPVYRLTALSEDVQIDIGNAATYSVDVQPLNPLPNGWSRSDWGEKIGYGADPSTLLTGDPKELFQLNLMPNTGMPPQLLEQPTSEYDPNYKIAHGAKPDEKIPLRFWSDWALKVFLNERGLRLRGTYNRQNSLRLAKRVLQLMKELGHRAPQPREWQPNGQTAYDEDEPLDVADGDGTMTWNSSWKEVADALQSIERLNDENFFKSFGTGRNGIQTRAQRLIKGGHFNIGKIQTAKCRIKSTSHAAIAIRVECVPSMKSEAYWVTFVCDLDTNTFVSAPVSRCGCPAGLGGCSHLRAEYALFSKIQSSLQQDPSLSQEAAVSMFPPAMQNMRKLPIPWTYAYHDDEADKDLKRLKKKREHEYRKQSAALNSTLLDLNSGLDLPDDTEDDDDDDDDDDSYSPSEEDSMSASDNEWDEEDLLTTSTEDDELITDEDLVDIIEITELPRPSDVGESDIKLCEFVEKSISTAVLRAKTPGGKGDIDYKMERSKISKYLQDLLDGKGGPNESIHTKLRQLERQEKMYHAFHTDKTLEKCLLSHYLLHTRPQRLASIDQLKYAIEKQMTKDDLNWPAERLSKLPKGKDGLGDRGFEGTSTSYPNCNPMKTPCFLENRDQFTYAETIGTRDLCQARYGSEAYNKRTNDHAYIQDKIPRSNFVYTEAVLKWSMFHANMCQPFLMPHDCNEYFPKNTAHLQKPSKQRRAQLSILSQPTHLPQQGNNDNRPLNYIEVAMPQRYIDIGLEDVGLLMDGKDCVTDTVRLNSFISRAQYSDKMHCSAGRYIMWVLPCGLGVTYTPLFLGRASEKALVEYWGGSTYDLLSD